MQPLVENLKLIDREMIASYFEMLFRHVEDGYAVMLRGIGEGGTEQEGLFRENVPLPMDTMHIIRAAQCAERWGQHHVASFIVPAAMDKSIFNDAKGTEDRLRLFTTVLADIDKGDTDSALAYLTQHIGKPTMVVQSGGTTPEGKPKRHIYWALTEPTADIATVAALRGMIASKIGGDPSFKRAAQVVRIPGTVYAKGGIAKTCAIESYDAACEAELADLMERANEMPLWREGHGMNAPWPLGIPRLDETMPDVAGISMRQLNDRARAVASFAQFAGMETPHPVGSQLVDQIHAGGEGENTRWSAFNQVAGHYWHCVRKGELTLAEADAAIRGWIATSMIPPWPDERIVTEMRGLLAKDVRAHGPFEHTAAVPADTPPNTVVELPPSASPNQIKAPEAERVFDVVGRWDVARLTSGDKPKRQFLIEGLIQAGKPHLIAAEGGAGKTGQILDMGLKVAGYKLDHTESGGDRLRFWGQALTVLCAGKGVAIVTSEDDEEECHIRLKDMDEYGLLDRCAGKLFVVPLVDVGGAFPFVHKGRFGDAEPSKSFKALFDDLAKIPNLGLVIIDTLNSTLHGEDVRPDVIQEYFNQLVPKVCGEWKAALIVTHHIRKAGKKPISNLTDMKDAVRGSSALPAAVRAVIGFWHAPNFKKLLSELGMPVEYGRCYMAGVVKANNGEFIRSTKTLVRDDWGVFLDKSADKKLKAITEPAGGLEAAWLMTAVARAVRERHPFPATWTSKTKGLYARRAWLPAPLLKLPRKTLEDLTEALIGMGKLIYATPEDSKMEVLDVKGGKAAKQQGYSDTGERPDVDWDAEYQYLPATMQVLPREKRQ